MYDDEVIRQWRGPLNGCEPTVAEELAAGLRWPFKDDKALYPEVNIVKMHAGIPLIRRVAGFRKIDESATPA